MIIKSAPLTQHSPGFAHKLWAFLSMEALLAPSQLKLASVGWSTLAVQGEWKGPWEGMLSAPQARDQDNGPSRVPQERSHKNELRINAIRLRWKQVSFLLYPLT